MSPPLVPHGTALTTAPLVPLTPEQQQLWYFERLRPGTPTYNVPLALLVSGDLHTRNFERCVATLARRHPELCGAVLVESGRPFLRLPEAPHIDFRYEHDLGEPPSDALVRALAAATDVARTPFALGRSPLLRVRLYALGLERHLLLLVAHHIVVDGHSMRVLVRELSDLLQVPQDQTADKPRTAIPANQPSVESARAGADLEYWKQVLAGAPTTTTLPSDIPRPPRQTFVGATYRYSMRGSTERVRTLARQLQCSPFAVWLAVFTSVAAQMSGASDLVIGAPTSGRQSGREDAIGYLVKTLPIRLRFGPTTTFRELARQARDRVFEALAHRAVSLPDLVDAASVERTLDRTPLFQVLVSDEGVVEGTALGSLACELVPIDTGTAKVDLSLIIGGTADRDTIQIEYAVDLFTSATIARLAARIETALAAASAHPEVEVVALPIIPEGERRELMAWSAGGDARLIDLYESLSRWAHETPASAAVKWRERTWSYDELLRQVDHTASWLAAEGLAVGDVLALVVERVPDVLFAMLAAWKLGAVYVPIDPRLPEPRIRVMLDEIRPRITLADASFADRFPECKVLARAARPAPGGHVIATAQASPSSDALAYVIYTSGSTGLPKGVAIKRIGVAALLGWVSATFSRAEFEIVAASTSISFDLAVFELFGTWAMGGCVLFVDDALALRETTEPITLVSGVPSVIAELLRDGPLPASVRTVTLAGEVLPASTVHRLYAGGVERVWNLYGPTETTVFATAYVCPREVDANPPIGRPMPGWCVYVKGESGQLLPIGVEGELWIGGVAVARGYVSRPELTRARFVSDPVQQEASLYRSGDIARWNAHGQLEFVGRTDDQVKLRGFRIELGDVTSHAMAHPEVTDAVTVLLKDPDCLVTYAVATQALSSSTLREFLRDRVPSYMIPAQVIFVPKIPRLISGKVDRRALPAPDGERPTLTSIYQPPRTLAEDRVRRIWEEVLGVDGIGVRDAFFDLGGNSLQAAALLTRVEDELGVPFPMAALYEGASSIEEMAVMLERGTHLAERQDDIVRLSSTAEGAPLIAIHTGGGTVAEYMDLARLLAHSRTLYGIEATPNATTIDAFAMAYAGALRARFSTPLVLLGWSCAAGVIALETARVLRAAGTAVEHVFILDSPLPSPRPPEVVDDASFWKWRFTGELELDVEELRALTSDDQVALIVRRFSSLWPRPPRDPRVGARARERLANSKRITSALWSYRAQPYDGRVLLLRAEVVEGQPSEGWRDLLPNLEIVTVSGTHATMLRQPTLRTITQVILDRTSKPIDPRV